ncbi:MAG: hypothetical protein RL094_142 [Candidatus Parcubacteria bacterium]|jgi:murein DD-endopeptidase MepM/ murein hydrolase activator NlpD
MGLPFFAEAGILSMMTSVFGGSSTNTPVVATKNAQKMDLLQAATNSDPNPSKDDGDEMIVNGEALTNENAAIGPDQDGSTKPNSDSISLYTVRKGDTLQQIAQMYNVTANTILWANDLKRGSVVNPGQVLVILPVSGVKYTVKKGDTIASVAKKYKADIESMAQYNNLEVSGALAVGDELIIPDGVFTNEGSPSTTKSSSGTSKILDSNLLGGLTGGTKSSTSGYFIRPIVGGIKTQGIHGHNGVDLASALGTPIRAAAAGTVVISKFGGWNGGYGNYVVIQHSNGTQTLYGHMNSVAVSVGEKVDQGENIGTMGNTGKSTGVHLHFEVRGGKNPF